MTSHNVNTMSAVRARSLLRKGQTDGLCVLVLRTVLKSAHASMSTLPRPGHEACYIRTPASFGTFALPSRTYNNIARCPSESCLDNNASLLLGML